MNYTLAWAIATVAALAGTMVLLVLTRSLGRGTFRNLLCLLPAVLMLVPAPVPGYAGYLAPAFVVAIFESAFVAEGQPRAALVILAVALVGATLAVTLLSRALTGTGRKPETALDSGDN